MAIDTKSAAYEPLKNKPNPKDPETARLLEHYASEMVTDGDGKFRKKFETCPVCSYAMSLQDDGAGGKRLACAWEPLHTPAK